MERIDYEIEERNVVLENLHAAGKRILEDITINLDENGRLTNCYCITEDATEPWPDETADMREALDILGVEVQDG